MDIEAKKEQYERISRRIETEVGHIDGVMFLILLVEGFGDSALAAIENEEEMSEFPESVRKACCIIAEELERGMVFEYV